MTLVAHVFLAPYTLPVPFWMYLYGCAATIVLSFALLAYLATSSLGAHDRDRRELVAEGTAGWLWNGALILLRAGSVLALVMTMATGVVGPADPATNIGMTLFWVYFLLAFTYLTVVIGDLYEWINPWNTMAAMLQLGGVDMGQPRLQYPRWIGYWPAVALYIALVWIELFALPRPSTLAAALAIYTTLTIGGMYAFGRTTWLRYADVFAVFFRIVGSLAPVEYVSRPSGGYPRISLRWPLSGALRETADQPSLVVFVLFMLSSTTYDAIHETYLWISLYWQRLLPALQPLWGTDIVSAQTVLTTGYWWYQWLGLVLSPMFYLALYLAVLWTATAITRVTVALGALATLFVSSLVPIAVAYHATHYVPSMLRQLPALLPQMADPLARGWQLLPFQPAPTAPLPMSIVWHVQVVALLAGHVAGVYLAHVAAMRVFPTRGQGIASQLPMLALMVGYTCLGLWVLSLPLGVPQVVPAGG